MKYYGDRVFKTDLAVDIYEAYEDWLSIYDFSGKKTTDMCNHLAGYLDKKGYSLPTPGVCLEQTIHIVEGKLANFMRDRAKDGVFQKSDLDEGDRKIFHELVTTYSILNEIQASL